MGRLTTQDYTQGHYRFSRGYLSMGKGDGGFRRGIYHHPEGLVEVFECLTKNTTRTNLYLTRGGYTHTRSWDAAWGDKTIANLARRFIEDIIREQ